MNSFPYDSWEHARTELGAYYTFADNSSIVKVITFIGIAMSIYWMYSFMSVENKTLTEEASKLAGKYRG